MAGRSRVLSWMVEWRWAQGQLATPVDRFRLASDYWTFLEAQHGSRTLSSHAVLRGLAEVLKDIERCLKSLNYGDSPVGDAPQRLARIERMIEGEPESLRRHFRLHPANAA